MEGEEAVDVVYGEIARDGVVAAGELKNERDGFAANGEVKICGGNEGVVIRGGRHVIGFDVE